MKILKIFINRVIYIFLSKFSLVLSFISGILLGTYILKRNSTISAFIFNQRLNLLISLITGIIVTLFFYFYDNLKGACR